MNSTIKSGNKNLFLRMALRVLWGQLIVAALLFGAARTIGFWQGWAYLTLNAAAMICIGGYFYKRDPALLERRLLRKEKQREQKLIMVFWKMLAGTSLILAGLDNGHGWSRSFAAPVPVWLVLLSLFSVLCGQILYFLVLKANSFAASVIQVESGQSVITSGLYGVVRHPMYLSFAILTFFTPFALGSFIAWPVSALILPLLVLRLVNEEKILRRDLPGYAEYCQGTRRRLIPLLW